MARIGRAQALVRGMVAALCLALCLCGAGCEEDPLNAGRLELVWGRRGISAGRLQKPRCMALDAQDRLYVVDMTARIQVFTADGEYLHGWQTPEHVLGRPTGITVTDQGEVLVADTHYNRVLIYTPEGKLLRVLGGDHVGRPSGGRPGELGLVTCALRDAEGNYYISEYGEYDRVQKFSPQGEFLLEWGGHGTRPGQFSRPQKMAWDEQQRIWIVDACNHRIQVFDREGRLQFYWGRAGSGPGELYYPYDLDFDAQGNVVVCEFGNHRVQKFTRDGRSLGCWGRHGRGPGELHHPWAVRVDRRGRIHVLDTNNHRIQRIVMP
jgi:DNA-binding beta-propeller fold protein YncE